MAKRPSLTTLDKDIAVLTALFTEHKHETRKNTTDLRNDIHELRSDITKLKVKTYGIVGVISLLLGAGGAWISNALF